MAIYLWSYGVMGMDLELSRGKKALGKSYWLWAWDFERAFRRSKTLTGNFRFRTFDVLILEHQTK